ncbi:MAG: F0F1 ATP synthase subunit gamma [Bifidobacteriaceae bacterium]|jgi:F-type H+-transporting ATPase subunit gamma|nr:F0F1 ATP synthase subunit gamma [Bifidobacteriaceae bacterium]
MAGSQRVYRARIRSTQALKKIFRAMELIAASRIGRARDAAGAQAPYARALTRAVGLAATHAGEDLHHPLLSERTDTKRVALLVLAADRGMAGAYTANVLREAEAHAAKLEAGGQEVVRYVVGRRAAGYYEFRGVPLAGKWLGVSDSPTFATAKEIANTLIAAFSAPADSDQAVGELHVVYTHFKNMVSQQPRIIRMLPLEFTDEEAEVVPDGAPAASGTAAATGDAAKAAAQAELYPLYSFEPSAHAVLDALLPRYIRSRIYDCLLQAAASELANRQRAMHTATDNAEDLVRKYTRLANQARQADITQEISEIVSGADAMAAGN